MPKQILISFIPSSGDLRDHSSKQSDKKSPQSPIKSYLIKHKLKKLFRDTNLNLRTQKQSFFLFLDFCKFKIDYEHNLHAIKLKLRQS